MFIEQSGKACFGVRHVCRAAAKIVQIAGTFANTVCRLSRLSDKNPLQRPFFLQKCFGHSGEGVLLQRNKTRLLTNHRHAQQARPRNPEAAAHFSETKLSDDYGKEELGQTALVRNRTLQENGERRHVPEPHAGIEQIEQNDAVFRSLVENRRCKYQHAGPPACFFCAFCGAAWRLLLWRCRRRCGKPRCALHQRALGSPYGLASPLLGFALGSWAGIALGFEVVASGWLWYGRKKRRRAVARRLLLFGLRPGFISFRTSWHRSRSHIRSRNRIGHSHNRSRSPHGGGRCR